MKNLKLALVCLLLSAVSHVTAQTHHFELERSGKTKILKIKENQSMYVALNNERDNQLLSVSVFEGQIANLSDTQIKMKLQSLTNCVYIDSICVKKQEITYNEGHSMDTILNIGEVAYLQKAKSPGVEKFHMATAAISTLFNTIFNPIISNNFKTGEINSQIFRYFHIASASLFFESIIYATTSRKKFYINQGLDAEKIWELRRASVSR